MLAKFVSGEFLLHIPCWRHFYLGSISYTSHAAFIFIWGVSLTPPFLPLIWSADILLHFPCSFHFYRDSFSYKSCAVFIFFVGSFSYTSRSGVIFMWAVSLTHPMLDEFLSRKFLLHIPCWLLFFIWGVSLTHPVLPSLSSREFLLHIPCWHHFYLGSFSYTSHAGFFYILIWGFFLHIPCWLHCYLGSFSYTSHAGIIFNLQVSLTHPMLASLLSGEFLLHIPCWL